MSIEKTLEERGNKYGEFGEHARITQNIKAAMVDSPNWSDLPDNMKEALEMTAHKIGRILNGDPTYHDSWHDIVGYNKLVADALLPKEGPTPAPEKECSTDSTDALSFAIKDMMDRVQEREKRRRVIVNTMELIDRFFGPQETPTAADDGWIPFTATRDSVCPVDPSTIVSIATVESRRAGRVLPSTPAGHRCWNSRLHEGALIVAYKVEKQP